MKLTKIFAVLILSAVTLTAGAQRVTDKLDRGLIGIKTTSGVFLSWRIQADEYYDVKYNLYKDGNKIAENLNVSNYTDAGGSTTSKYTVAAVVNGKEQAQCAAVTPWEKSYFEIAPKHNSSLKCTYVPNDGCCADVDGDGQVEILLKYNNKEESAQLYPKAGPTVNDEETGEYTLLEVLKLDGTVLWWVNCGPNMGDFQNNEQNIVGCDWDQDGKAEVVMRLEEGSQVHMADGTVYTIGADGKNGTSWTNYREPKSSSSTEWFTHYGKEFLFYCEGATGKPYQCIDYPLKRLESGETDLNAAWGDGYGHRSSKFFFGAPYLDGRHPSIFLGRGIYTRHKFIAYDVNPTTHALTQRWYWSNNQKGSPWYGEGYHNYAVVDVDWDGRDEIVWGSMVIDDNGKGLSTTGLGHGDAQHHGDFDPYTYGQEGFFCNEDKPANNYRDLTTSKFYHRVTGSNDDGRAICGQFDNKVPGAIGFSAHDNAISCVTGDYSSYVTKTGVSMNFRCYWDGDLEEESFDGGGDGGNGHVYKYGQADAIETFDGSISNNSTKSTPTYMGDILGDWREEFIMRDANNHLRIYSTTIATANRNYSLWYDKQYRNGMVWEPCGYNQPPHASYYLGDLEGITMAPPAETMMGRTEVVNGGTISNSGEQVITCETNDMTVKVADGATPYLYIDNTPSWVQGWAQSESTAANDPSKITYKYYTHTLTGGAFAGDMRLVKQGAGTLVLPNVTQTYNGQTEVWAGTLNFDGTLANSKLWLNRLTALNSDGGTFSKGIQADYGAVIRPGGVDAKASSITTDTLKLGFGAVCMLDLYSDGLAADQLNAKVLSIEKKEWPYGGGPAYDTPVFRFNAHAATGESAIADGKYCLGTVGKVEGSLDDIVIENMSSQKTALTLEDGKLYITVVNFKGKPVTWKGDKSGTWDLDSTENFTSNETGEASKFVTDSPVTFDDSATKTAVTVSGNLKPGSITFANSTKAYTLSGDSIVGEPALVKDSVGTVTINSVNHMGNTTINGGTLNVASLANTSGTDYGSLGSTKKTISLKGGGTLGIPNSITSNQKIVAYNGAINVASGKTLTQAAAIASAGDKILTKQGAGTLKVTGSMSANQVNVEAGTLDYSGTAFSKTVKLSGTAAISGGVSNNGSYGFVKAPIIVASGAKATYTCVNRTTASNKITGDGQLTVSCILEKGTNYYATRNPIAFDLSEFEGTIVATTNYPSVADAKYFTMNTSKGNDKWTLNTNGMTINNYGQTLRIGKVTGTGSLGGNDNFGSSTSSVNNWQVGDSTDVTLSAPVVGNARFTKLGTGTMKITIKTWTTTGAVYVNEGTLFCNGGTLGKATCTVAAGATLCGFGGAGLNLYTTAQNNPMTNSSYTINGTLQCMYSASSMAKGCWYFNNKNVTINKGGELKVGITKASTSATVPNCAHIFGINKLTMAEGAKVTAFFASTYKPAATEEKADTFNIFGANTTAIGNITYDLASLSDYDAGTNQNGQALSYFWDTSKISEGKLMVCRGLKGDVNNDGQVNISDVNAVITVMCGGTFTSRADVNGDGAVNISDVNSIISIMCGGE